MIQVIKKDGTLEDYDEQKIINACNKAARRAMVELSDNDYQIICNSVWEKLVENDLEETEVYEMHNIVESVLEEFYPKVAKMYKEYRNYKKDFIHMMDDVYTKSQSIRYIGDKSNANTDSALVATKRSLIFNELNKELYRKFFMTVDELQACKDGYIYVHDQSARLDTMNCFRRDTRFITNNGIKSFYDFSDGDTTVVLSHKGIWRKATVHKYGWQPIQKVTFKKGTHTSKPVDIYCTKNHRWILKNGDETTNLSVGDILYQIPDITKFDWNELSLENKKLWCNGFAKGDGALIGGTHENRPNYIILRLCGEKQKFKDRFIDAGYNVTFPESSDGDCLVHMLDMTTKEVPFLILNHTNILYYINGLMCADGHRQTSENPSCEFRGIQVTGELNKYIYDLLNMSGYFVTSTQDLTGTETNYGVRTEQTIKYQLSSSQTGISAWRVADIMEEKLNPKSEVWCLEVEEDHSFILECGIATGNCCLFDAGRVMKDGFEMGNVWYNEPNSLDVAFDVLGDIILSTAAQQYGGFTVPEIDKVLEPYAEKSYQKYLKEFKNIAWKFTNPKETSNERVEQLADEYATAKVRRDFEQGFQGIEYKLNTVGSSRGDYPFTTMTFGLSTSKFGKMASIIFLNVHKEGQGKKGYKKPVLFPKLVFLYDEKLHGKGCINEDVFEAGIACSAKTMYPDWLSMSGDGYISEMYKRYGKVISPMGCRAFLSPWYERGGMNPADENDSPVFVGRFNIGAVSLHLPMILAKSRKESKDFYQVLDYYLEMIRGLHKRTYDYLGEMKASVNPLAYCEGGFYGGNLKPSDKIKSILKPMTASFGITALNELQELYNGKSIVEDGEFALEVMRYINDRVNEFKAEDGWLYAIYGTPAESLCFSGDTMVQAYGGEKAIKDIKEGDLVYSYNEALKRIELKPVLMSKQTSPKRNVVEVVFDNGQRIVCTPEHPFAKRTMVQDEKGQFVKEVVEYVPAYLLKKGNRIKSNYITINADGHYKCTTDQYIHDINAEYKLGKKPNGYVTHHKDENKLNNLFENLSYMIEEEHKRHHIANNIEKYQFTHESACGENNLFYGKKHTDASIESNRQLHLGKNNVGSKQVVQMSMDGEVVNIFESRGIAERETGFKNISYACNGKYSTKNNPHEYKGYVWYFASDIDGFDEMNHKVLSVNYLPDEIPVYDIEVADNHNFYVGGMNGILVHNCGLQIEQFRKMYGIIDGVSSRTYVSNSFHCGVWEDINPIEKQDLEGRFWNLCNGGKIQYVRYPIDYNIEAIRTLVRRAMEKGFYEGVNLSLSYCEDCGYEQLEMDVCPKCGSSHLTKIDRMNGYLSYSRVKGDTRLNSAKMDEIADRISM